LFLSKTIIDTALELLKDKPQVQLPSFLSIGYSINLLPASPTSQIGTFSGCCSALNKTLIVWSLRKQELNSLLVGILILESIPLKFATVLFSYFLYVSDVE